MLSEAQIKQDILSNFTNWKGIAPEHIKVQKMTGITNLTYKIELMEGHAQPSSIIYRRFGESQQNVFLSRIEEIHIYQTLSQSGDGPKIYYYDQKIRLQQFLESSVLQPNKMLTPGFLEEVAFTLSRFHSIKPESEKISKINLIRKTFINRREQMLTLCLAKLNKNIYTPEEEVDVAVLKKWVTSEEIDIVGSIIDRYQKEPEVFSHNDLLANNVLIRKDNGKFVFIDYQYASFNFPFYDIANYFEESQIDYDVTHPPYYGIIPQKPGDQEMKIRFVDAYVIAKDWSHEEFKLKFQQLRKEPKYIHQRQKLMSQVVVGRLLCSLMWGWWGIIVSKNPLIQFDYIKFARMRYDNYCECKKQLLK